MSSLEVKEDMLLPNLDRVRSIIRLLQKDDAVAALVGACNEVGEAFLFGGIVRDAIFSASGAFGDIDIFVSGPLDFEFIASLSRYSRRTNFGGMRLVVGRFDVDIWELPKSYAFRVERGRTVSIPSLLETVCFSSDAVAVSLIDGRVISSRKFRDTVKRKVLRFVSAPAGLEILQAVRVARLMVKTGLVPDRDVSAYFCSAYKEFGVVGLIRAEGKWKGRRLLDDFLIESVFDICEKNAVSGPVESLSIDKDLFYKPIRRA